MQKVSDRTSIYVHSLSRALASKPCEGDGDSLLESVRRLGMVPSGIVVVSQQLEASICSFCIMQKDMHAASRLP